MKNIQRKGNFFNWLLSISVAAIFLFSLAFPGGSVQASPPDASYVIVFKDTVNPAVESDRVAKAYGLQRGFIYQHALKGFAAALSDQCIVAVGQAFDEIIDLGGMGG